MADMGMDVQEFAHLEGDFQIEIIEEHPPFLEERQDVVCIIGEKRRIAVGGDECLPMQMPPVSVVTDAYVSDGCLVDRCRRGVVDGTDIP